MQEELRGPSDNRDGPSITSTRCSGRGLLRKREFTMEKGEKARKRGWNVHRTCRASSLPNPGSLEQNHLHFPCARAKPERCTPNSRWESPPDCSGVWDLQFKHFTTLQIKIQLSDFLISYSVSIRFFSFLAFFWRRFNLVQTNPVGCWEGWEEGRGASSLINPEWLMYSRY